MRTDAPFYPCGMKCSAECVTSLYINYPACKKPRPNHRAGLLRGFALLICERFQTDATGWKRVRSPWSKDEPAQQVNPAHLSMTSTYHRLTVEPTAARFPPVQEGSGADPQPGSPRVRVQEQAPVPGAAGEAAQAQAGRRTPVRGRAAPTASELAAAAEA